MTAPETRPPAFSEREIQLLERLASGARVSVTDPRLTSAIGWLLGLVGVTFLSVAGWLISNDIEQGKLMQRVVTILEQHDRRLDRLEERRP